METVAQQDFVTLPPKRTRKYDNWRRYRLAEPGVVRLDQRIVVRGQERGYDVTGKYWIFGIIRVRRGSIRYLRGKEWVQPCGRTFGMFVPPRSLIEVQCDDSDSSSMGLASAKPLPASCHSSPVIFRPWDGPFPGSLREMADFLRRSSDFVDAGRTPQPSDLGAQAKDLLDRTYKEPRRLGDILAKLGAAHARVTRVFRRDFGQTPQHYRTWLRVMDGMMQLIEGKAVMDVSQEIGFEDLSRFYKQFGRIAGAPPGRYRDLRRSKNAKTGSVAY